MDSATISTCSMRGPYASEGQMNTLPEWLTGAGGGGVLAALAAYFGGKHHGRAEFINAVSEAADRVIKRLETRCDHLEARCVQVEQQQTDEREKCDAKLAEMRAQIDRLLRGPVATYPDRGAE